MSHTRENSEAFWNQVRLQQTMRDLALLFASAGVIALLAALVSVIRTQVVATWPVAPGVVTSSGVETMPIAGRIVRYEPVVVITYRYEVEGESYTSDTITRGAPPVGADSAEAERLLATYPVEAPVAVHYDPRDPSRSVLEQTLPEGTIAVLLLSFGLAAVFALVARAMRPRVS